MVKVRDFKKMLEAVPEAAKELYFLVEGKSDNQEMDLMDRNDYISWKLWQKEDLFSVLSEILEEVPSPIRNNVQAARESRNLIEMASKAHAFSYLNECTDAEWDCIRSVIQDTIREEFGIKKGTLVFYNEDGCIHTFSCNIECGTNRITVDDLCNGQLWMLRRYPMKVCFLDDDGRDKTGLVILPDIKEKDAVALQLTTRAGGPLYWIDIDQYDK